MRIISVVRSKLNKSNKELSNYLYYEAYFIRLNDDIIKFFVEFRIIK